MRNEANPRRLGLADYLFDETKPIRGGPDWLVAFITKRSQFGLPDSLFPKFQFSKNFCHHDEDRDPAGSCVDGAHVQSNSTSIMGSGEFRIGMSPTAGRAWRYSGATQVITLATAPGASLAEPQQPKNHTDEKNGTHYDIDRRAALSDPQCVSWTLGAILLRVVRFPLIWIASGCRQRLERTRW
jgi:hypothetical protein